MNTSLNTKSYVIRLVLIFFIVSVFSIGLFSQQNFAANIAGYDTARIYHAMAKARNGEEVTVVGIGGSITQGHAATTESNRWINRVSHWWETTFPSASINLVNAGWGGTGSAIGVHRLKDDVLAHNPDFVVIEFSVNDSEGDEAKKMMEGLARQLLTDPSHPGVMMLFLKQTNGTTAQASHKPVGEHYDIPMISFADLIDDQLVIDGIPIDDLFLDGLHPVDLGMEYIAGFITGELDTIYNHLPADIDLPVINTTLPAPLVTDIYDNTYMYDYQRIVADSNSGWENSSIYWIADEVDDEMTFKVDGNAVGILYTRLNLESRGQAEFWVDNGPHTVFDSYWTETWGKGTVYGLVEENLPDGEHTLHVKIVNSNSPGSTGHLFELRNVLKAGNIQSPSPIAVIDEIPNGIKDETITLNGTSSYDPDSESPLTYTWTLISSPAGSTASIADADSSVASFVPDEGGDYVVGLIVNDGVSNSVMNTQSVYVRGYNNAPVAQAGNDTTVATNTYITLNGNNSSDADDDELTFFWQIIDKPAGSSPVFLYYETSEARINPTVAGEYNIGLTVNDGFTDSPEDIITITAIDNYTGTKDLFNHNIHLAVFPNPANDHFYIEYTLSISENTDISVYNTLGVKIKTVLHEKKTSGSYKTELSVEELGLDAGYYFIRLSTEEREKVINLVVN